MCFQFLVDTYRTEIEKVLSVWSMFDDRDLLTRPHHEDPRGRSLLEHMIHQCVSENLWFELMLNTYVTDNPLPPSESRIEFIRTYYRDANARLLALTQKSDRWWTDVVSFFDMQAPRTWIVVRRIAHTAHHRGQQTTLLRILRRDLHSTYGPTADTGGLMQHNAPVIYPYPTAEELVREESSGRQKAILPSPGDLPVTERPALVHVPGRQQVLEET